MTNRRDGLPEEYRDLQPEEFVDVYVTDDGRMITPTAGAVAALVDDGQYVFAFAMMRQQLQNDAMRALRADGCSFRRYEQVWRYDFDGSATDSAESLAALTSDAIEHLEAKPSPERDAGASAALEVLLALQWQSSAMDSASSETERETLRRMALVSGSLGVRAGQTHEPHAAFPELHKLRERTVKQSAPLLKQAADNAAEADAWRAPLSDYVATYLAKGGYDAPYLGLWADILKDYRTDHPEARLPGSDGPNRHVGTVGRKWFADNRS